jgi:hypothetical protein
MSYTKLFPALRTEIVYFLFHPHIPKKDIGKFFGRPFNSIVFLEFSKTPFAYFLHVLTRLKLIPDYYNLILPHSSIYFEPPLRYWSAKNELSNFTPAAKGEVTFVIAYLRI